MYGFGDTPLVGVDIGSTSVKVAFLKQSKRGFELSNFEMIPFPPYTIVVEDTALSLQIQVVPSIS